jgi:hypothetical protein
MSNLIITALGNKELSGIYIGRPSVLGNPYPTKVSNFRVDKIYTNEESMEKYRRYILKEIKTNEKLKKILMTLKKRILDNKDIQLNCWCILEKINFKDYKEKENVQCHGQIIYEYLYFNITKKVKYEKKDKYYIFNLPKYLLNNLKEYKLDDNTIKIEKDNNKINELLEIVSGYNYI